MKKFALISVSDKTNILEFAKKLLLWNYEILATGGTAKLLKQNEVTCTEISDYTGFPEIFDGRVKTLQPKIFGGILQRRNLPEDQKQAEANGILPIDIVCVNLYPFEKVAKNPATTEEELIENIDIGGPSLIRAAAKNHKFVSVLTSPAQYENFLSELESGAVAEETRKRLAVAAYSHTSQYDTFISNTLENRFGFDSTALRLHLPKTKTLRYGENPHQQAALYGSFFDYFEIIHGKELSYNNILDITAAVELLEELEQNSCVIVKHNNPSGAATASSILEAYQKALQCDPVAAFGGIVALNETVDITLASKLNELFLEVVIAPAFTDEALPVLFKKKDRRILKQVKKISEKGLAVKAIPGGVLVQDKDFLSDDFSNLKTVTENSPSEKQLEDLKFAWAVAKNAKSNAIIFAKDKMTLGIGAGQVSRIDAVKVAVMKAAEFGLSLEKAVVASDAFFPFADNIEEVVKHGITAVIEPGGSVRDEEVINAANKYSLSMVFTGKRHFKH
ncbi:MAG: bifunctional phosphoribosylaminoimidazolecarboxamide formyltransferase/IMP cyclohydrolase [Ignavibacteriaceae bacterium]|nr:bifunctional phosphoribosylaminoimidazolecarboxamide formyltransferase/IMP cyclohydrolase [Ignavibacteriaceae bacterium]